MNFPCAVSRKLAPLQCVRRVPMEKRSGRGRQTHTHGWEPDDVDIGAYW